MSDRNLQHDGQDRTRIEVRLDHELAYWSQRFGVTRDVLRAAVEAAGPLAISVERHLREQERGDRIVPTHTLL